MIIYHAANGSQQVRLSHDVLTYFERYRQLDQNDPEAGGQLFALITENVVTIVNATGPYLRDKRSRFGLIIDEVTRRKDIRRFHKQGLHFIGDWHTHPEPHPLPSPIDDLSMLDMFRRSDHELAAFIMIIVGQAEFPKGLYVAAVNNDGTHPLPKFRI